jgi:hypothetical protein
MFAGAFGRREWRMANGEWQLSIRHSPFAIRRLKLAGVLGICGLWLTACGFSIGVDDGRAGLSCVDDTPQCIERRQATLKTMLSDKERRWVREAPTPQAHASGVRLFAFRSAKAELSCEELVHGRREAESAPLVLKGALKGQANLTPAQVSRAALFAAEVQRELAAEIRRRRCRA